MKAHAFRAPAFQLYAKEFLQDEAVVLMDLEAVGAYIILLCHQWTEGSIPAEPALLARICRATTERMEFIWPQIQSKFARKSGGRLANPKLEIVRQEKESYRAKQAEFGRISAENRRESKRREMTHMDKVAQSNPEATLEGNGNSGSSSGFGPGSEENTDLDYQPTNRKNRDSQVEQAGSVSSKQYPELAAELTRYFREDGQEELTPSDRVVADVMDAAGGATECAVVGCLHYLYHDRGLRPGTKNGPKHWSWFPVLVRDYFRKAANPALTCRDTAPACMDTAEVSQVSECFDPVSNEDAAYSEWRSKDWRT